MLSRATRLAAALLCGGALVVSGAAGTAAAKGPGAQASVVGGTPATLTEWGFAAAILTPHTLCTGSVLSPVKVLTAAHCVSSPPTMTVRTNSTLAFSGGEVHTVRAAAINPAWTRGFVGDLAVVTLGNPTSAPPIQLVSPAEDPTLTAPGAVAAVAGFGARNPAPRRQPKIGPLTTAQVSMRRFCPLPASLICDAGGRSGLIAIARVKRKLRKRPIQKTVCAGDSGGPMVAAGPAGPRLIGVAEATAAPPKRSAFGFVWCGLKGFPAIHTRVTSWLSFISGS